MNFWRMTHKRVNCLANVLVILVLLMIEVVKSCPTNCLCYFDGVPRSVLCSNQGLKEFPEKISDLVVRLDLSNNNLDILSDDISRLIELKLMNLSKNKLTRLNDAIGNLWKLEKLDLSENFIIEISQISVIEKLPNLKFLILRKNPLVDLNHLTSFGLKALDVSECGIKELKNNSLVNLPELISLNLNGNPLTSIQRIRSEKLRWLDLSNCMLNLISPNTFIDVPELEHLRMENNHQLVFSTRKETLRHANLKKLNVAGCNLDRPGIHGFPSLTYAKLSRNSIRFLPNHIFFRNRMLTHLYLNENGLFRLNNGSFIGIPRLEVLDLAGNVIENLPKTLLQDNIHLRVFNLSFNNIKNLPEDFLTSAIVVDLSSNQIEDISTLALTHMPRLRSLNLSKNRLEVFDSGLISPTLKILDLEGNRLLKLTNESFSNLQALTSVDLSGNRLTEGMNYEVFKHNPNIGIIRLQDNPWRCDCDQIYSTFHYLHQGSKTKLSTLICQSPSNITGFSWAAACYNSWYSGNQDNPKRNNAHGLILMFLLIAVLIFGSCVSIRHTIKAKKRQAELRLQEAERAEARERLIHHRRARQMEELRQQENNVPRVHPEELIGPPTYEEAVEMPRFVRSLENLESTTSIDGVGQSNQSLDHETWARKRKKQSRKRAATKHADSEDSLNAKNGGRSNNSLRSENSNRNLRTMTKNSERYKKNINEREEPTCSVDNEFQHGSRPRTPNNYRRKRRLSMKYNEHSSDDEDSDILENSTVGARRSTVLDDARVIDLPREPRSGTYRPSIVDAPLPSPASSLELGLSSEPCDGSVANQFHISTSRIV